MTLALIGSDLNRNLSISQDTGGDLLVSQRTRDDVLVSVSGSFFYFNGLSKTSRGYIPYSRIAWEDYYTLDGDYGIGVRRIRPSLWEIGLLYDGARELSVVCNLADLYAFPEDMSDHDRISKDAHKISWHHPKKVWSYWNAIKTRLSLMACNDDNAQKILQAMEKWEQTSWETYNWLKEVMCPQNDPPAEMHVAGKLWLWHDWGRETVTVGKGREVWGKTQLRSRYEPGAINRASPFRDGWLVELTHTERYLLRWNGRVFSTCSFFFPYGKWEKRGKWILWPRDSVAFALTGGFRFPSPQFRMVGAGDQYALSVWRPNEEGFLAKNEVIMTDLFGIDTPKALPFDEKIKRVCVGSESMLFVTCDKNIYVLNIVDISNLSFYSLVRSVLFQGNGDCVVYAIKSRLDVYAVIYQAFEGAPIRILLIDTEGRVALVPYTHYSPSLKDVFRTMMPKNNHLIVEVIDKNGYPTGQILRIGMRGQTGYISFPGGVTTRYEATELGGGFWALSNYLSEHDSGA